MKYHFLILAFLLCLFPVFAYSQNYKQEYSRLLTENKFSAIEQLLSKWENERTSDPEFYVTAINYYFKKSKSEIISLQPKENKSGFSLTESTGKTVAIISSNVSYDSANLFKAIMYANKGIEKCPLRLDIRFGKCHLLQQIEDFESFTQELIVIIQYSSIIKNDWLWKNNEQLKNGESFLLETVHDYLRQLYEAEDEALLKYMDRIGETSISFYPNNIQILSITAVANLLMNNFDKAVSYLKKAETINPKDFIVLNNIAQAYSMMGDNENAIKYYELVKKYGDEYARKDAERRIKELKKIK